MDLRELNRAETGRVYQDFFFVLRCVGMDSAKSGEGDEAAKSLSIADVAL